MTRMLLVTYYYLFVKLYELVDSLVIIDVILMSLYYFVDCLLFSESIFGLSMNVLM